MNNTDMHNKTMTTIMLYINYDYSTSAKS